jgi:cobalt-zinc-cadmium efflux system protein
MAVAGVGILINGATALLFMRGSQDDINIRGAFLHMAADALVSLAVVVGGALTLWQGWTWIDPVMSLGIAVVIVLGTLGLLRQSVHLLFDGVPDGLHLDAVQKVLLALPGVAGVHDLHVWSLGTSATALTAHVVMRDAGADVSAVLHEAEHALHEHFEIRHVTLQVEPPDFGLACALRAGCHGSL